MVRTKNSPDISTESFGQRLARLRQAADYSQRTFAAEIGISQRMVAYYEKQSDYPPTHLLPTLAKVLNVSADQLLGISPLPAHRPSPDNRLWRRFNEVAKLPPPIRTQIVNILDAFLEREKLKISSNPLPSKSSRPSKSPRRGASKKSPKH